MQIEYGVRRHSKLSLNYPYFAHHPLPPLSPDLISAIVRGNSPDGWLLLSPPFILALGDSSSTPDDREMSSTLMGSSIAELGEA